MKERPILFSGPMVRAILEGRKTQTRRVVKPQPYVTKTGCVGWGEPWGKRIPNGPRSAFGGRNVTMQELIGDFCPYGKPGDRLWVRETWGVATRPDPAQGWVDGIEYKADEAYIDGSGLLPLRVMEDFNPDVLDKWRGRWCRSIHMPRWASRILLEVTDVRVQRVQEISEEDARAEGVTVPAAVLQAAREATSEYDCVNWSYVDGFATLWDSINKGRGYGWDVNPWVWAITFKQIEV